MKKSNVIDMQEFRELLKERKVENSYGRYLKTLGNSQLESEINFLLNEFADDSFDQDFHSRGKLILEEISSRLKV